MSYTITDITIDQLPIRDDRFHPLLCEEGEDIVISELLGRGYHDSGMRDSGVLVIYNDLLTRFSSGYCEAEYDMSQWFKVVADKPLTPVDDLI